MVIYRNHSKSNILTTFEQRWLDATHIHLLLRTLFFLAHESFLIRIIPACVNHNHNNFKSRSTYTHPHKARAKYSSTDAKFCPSVLGDGTETINRVALFTFYRSSIYRYMIVCWLRWLHVTRKSTRELSPTVQSVSVSSCATTFSRSVIQIQPLLDSPQTENHHSRWCDAWECVISKLLRWVDSLPRLTSFTASYISNQVPKIHRLITVVDIPDTEWQCNAVKVGKEYLRAASDMKHFLGSGQRRRQRKK